MLRHNSIRRIMHIETENLIITKFHPNMAESVHKISLDQDNRRFVPDEVFATVEEAEKAICGIISFYDNLKKPQIYAVTLKNNNQHIGHVQAVTINNVWEIGYHISEKHTGKGYATQAINAFLPEIMKVLGISEILGVCDKENFASARVLEKCGFIKHCGKLRQHKLVYVFRL